MQDIKEHESFREIKQRLLKKYICKGCKREVEQKEMVIPLGPRKGEFIIANLGCKCENIGLAKKVTEERNNLRVRKLQKIFENNSLYNHSLEKATFESYKPTTKELQKAKDKLFDYANSFDPHKSINLLLYGDYGVGKSHLAAAVTKILMERGLSCLYLSVPKLLTKIRETYNKSSEYSEAEILDLICNVNLFVLDDLGTEYTNNKHGNDNWTHTKLFKVLDSRSGKPTIFTTNLKSDELGAKLNERNLSRVLDSTVIIRMAGPDYRRREFV